MSEHDSSISADSSSATPDERLAIGISFGNSNSSIAHTSAEGKAEVIANQEGDRQIPSTLSYNGQDEYHGTQAKAQLVRNSQNTIAYFRDFLGKDFKSIDPTACHASAHPIEQSSTIAFKVQESSSSPESTTSTLSVSTVTTRHFRRLASSASEYLGRKVNAAVVTVPTDFTDPQREALIQAAESAGLEILQLIHEPVAAVLAYDARVDGVISDKTILVADFGGTRSDVAVIACRGGMYTILVTAHDYSLGGVQLDQVLVDFFAKEFIKKHKTDPRDNPRSLAKLKLEAEATKKALSLGSSASIGVESLADGLDFSMSINRIRYELLAGKVFGDFVALIDNVLRKGDMDVLDIDEVILSGGTSHTPKIAQLLQLKFPKSTTIHSPSTLATALNPSELCVRGAAIQASLIQEFDKEDIDQSSHPMVTVTPHLTRAIGVMVQSKDDDSEPAIFHPLLEAETAIPTRRTATFLGPKKEEGGDVLVRLCEGIREIRVSKVEKKKKVEDVNGTVEKMQADSDADESADGDDEEEEEEEEEAREKIWKVERVLAEAAVRDVGKGKRVEVMANVASDLSIQFTAREVGAKGGVRGAIAAGS
ncbi:MAG: Hsp70 protein that interacts with Zuo1p [Peltula sp. TS41687]|nr:MAG: Hsp70 protein that interacts with Zuo1p [Peltula sp. TS41687]